MKACLIGKTLKHSFSKQIHECLGIEYDLCEVAEENLAEFVQSKKYACYNVTIPYKEKIMPLLDEIDKSALDVGSVNTVVTHEGKLVGFNTDIYGMKFLFDRQGICIKDKNVVILGTGGTSKTALALSKREGAKKITIVGRTQEWNYQNYHQLVDTQILINTTPVGMYPNVDDCIVDISVFEKLEFVVDVIYNPLKTNLLLQAQERGIPCSNGLSMLVYQAIKAEEIWRGENFDNQTKSVLCHIENDVSNIVLVGMPACGKSSIGKVLAQITGKKFVDIDCEIEKNAGCKIPQIFEEHGEKYFRDLESNLICEFAKVGGLIISTGGGAPIRKENATSLKRNGFVVWVDRDLNLLTSANRPLSQQKGVQALYEERKEVYKSVADCIVKNDETIQEVAQKIVVEYEKNLGN